MREKVRRFITICIISAFIVVLVSLIVWSKFYLNIGVACPFHEIFGWECPGCGATRMAVAILHLDFYQAFRYNPFIFCTAPIVLVVYIWQFIVYVRNNILLKHLDTFLIAYTIALIIFGIIRNLSWFSYLAPTVVS